MSDFIRLTERIPEQFIKNPPQGKHGKYVSHDDIEQIALSKLGRPVSFEVGEPVYGYIPAWQGSGGKGNPERLRGIVGALGTITAVIDGVEYRVTEVGEANSPEVHSDGENYKTAASDAYKRCWMRFGVGLELWVEQGQNPGSYFLHAQLLKDSGAAENTTHAEGLRAVPDYKPGEEPFE